MTVSAIGSEPKVMDAIARASTQSGVGFDYLLATAKRESGLDCQAKSKSSSACGLYQFVAQTWLSTLKAHGAEHGLSAYADDIQRTASGQLSATDPARQSEILALRNDPTISAELAADLASDNAQALSAKLGRAPSNGELYAAHVLGAAGAAKLIALAGTTPGAEAASNFADAAPRNRGLFYDKAGAPVSVSALADRLTGGASAVHAQGLRPSVGLETSAPDLDAGLAPAWSYPVPGGESAGASAGLEAIGSVPTGSCSVWRSGMAQAPMTLSPQVLAILSSLVLPGSETETKPKNS